MQWDKDGQASQAAGTILCSRFQDCTASSSMDVWHIAAACRHTSVCVLLVAILRYGQGIAVAVAVVFSVPTDSICSAKQVVLTTCSGGSQVRLMPSLLLLRV